jgi:hypothetical protein
MKRFVFTFFLMLAAGILCVFGQESLPELPYWPGAAFSLDLTTFTGIVAAISLCATQLMKLFPFIGQKAYLKVLTSIGIGIASTLLAWHFEWAVFLTGLAWWYALFYGIGAGLIACGTYDLITNIAKKE